MVKRKAHSSINEDDNDNDSSPEPRTKRTRNSQRVDMPSETQMDVSVCPGDPNITAVSSCDDIGQNCSQRPDFDVQVILKYNHGCQLFLTCVRVRFYIYSDHMTVKGFHNPFITMSSFSFK